MGSTSGSASAWRNATVAPAIQAMANPIVAKAADTGPNAQGGRGGKRRECKREDRGAEAAELDQAVVAKQVVDRRRVDIDAGDRVAGELLARNRHRQRAALRPRPSGAVAKRFDVILRSSTSSTVPSSTTLPPNWRLKKSLSSFATQALGRRANRSECRRRRLRS